MSLWVLLVLLLWAVLTALLLRERARLRRGRRRRVTMLEPRPLWRAPTRRKARRS